jgi:hypothetical protein
MHRFYHFEAAYGRGTYEVDENGIVVAAAPFLKRFIGKKVDRLEAWIKLYKYTIVEKTSGKEDILMNRQGALN